MRKPRIKKLRVLARNPAVDLWAIDEVHIQQHGSRGRMWIPPEVADPVVLHLDLNKHTNAKIHKLADTSVMLT